MMFEWWELGLDPLISRRRDDLPDGRIALSDNVAVVLLDSQWIADRLPQIERVEAIGKWLTSVLATPPGIITDRRRFLQWVSDVRASPENQKRTIDARGLLPVEVVGLVLNARRLEAALQVLRLPEVDVRLVQAPGGTCLLLVSGDRAFALMPVRKGIEPIASYRVGDDTDPQTGLGFSDEGEEQSLDPDVDEELREELRDDFGEEFLE